MDYLLRFYKWVEKLIEPARNWLFENHANPFIWIGITIGTVLMFAVIYWQLWGKDTEK